MPHFGNIAVTRPFRLLHSWWEAREGRNKEVNKVNKKKLIKKLTINVIEEIIRML